MINKKINKWIVILLILSIFLSIANFSVFAADNEEPGEQMIGATFSQEFPKLGILTAKVTEYTPPKVKGVNDVSDIETKGLYKVVFSDGDYGQYYYSDLLKHGAKIPDDKEKSDL